MSKGAIIYCVIIVDFIAYHSFLISYEYKNHLLHCCNLGLSSIFSHALFDSDIIKQDHVVTLAMPSLQIFTLKRKTILSSVQKLYTPVTKGM